MFSKILIWKFLSKNYSWLIRDFLWVFGKFPGDNELLKCVAYGSVGGRVGLSAVKSLIFFVFTEMCRNHCGSPWLLELHSVHSNCGI